MWYLIVSIPDLGTLTYLAENIGNNIALYLYADDTKIFRQILTSEDSELLQEYIYDMSLWSDKWLLKFHPQK